jgi:hypothetical protein
MVGRLILTQEIAVRILVGHPLTVSKAKTLNGINSITTESDIMTPISEYMKLLRDDRRTHLKLNEPCDIRGIRYSYNLIGLVAYFLNTSIPQKGDNAIVCHGCNNPSCSNPNHLYWGSYKDNHIDQIESGTWQSPYERTVKKYGTDATISMLAESGKVGGKRLSGRSKSEAHKKNIANSQFGTIWITNGIENKKIKKENTEIPQGWYKGRVPSQPK